MSGGEDDDDDYNIMKMVMKRILMDGDDAQTEVAGQREDEDDVKRMVKMMRRVGDEDVKQKLRARMMKTMVQM